MSKIWMMPRYIWANFTHNFICMKTGILMGLQLFLSHIYLTPIYQFSMAAKYPVSLWVLPFMLMHVYFQFFFMLGVIYYYSNVPFMQYTQVYQIIRAGRLKWGIGKICAIVLSAFGIMFAEVVLSIIPLMGSIKFEQGWGKVLYTLAMTDVGAQYNIGLYFPYAVLTQYEPMAAMGLVMLTGVLVISLIGILMFALSIYFSRLCAVSAATIIAILPLAVKNVAYKYEWLVYFSPVTWMDLGMAGETGTAGYPKLSYILGMPAAAILVLCGFILWKVKSVDFDWNREDTV